MKKVWGFIFILIISFAVLTIYSFSSKTIKIGNIELKKTGINTFFAGDTIPKEGQVAIPQPGG